MAHPSWLIPHGFLLKTQDSPLKTHVSSLKTHLSDLTYLNQLVWITSYCLLCNITTGGWSSVGHDCHIYGKGIPTITSSGIGETMITSLLSKKVLLAVAVALVTSTAAQAGSILIVSDDANSTEQLGSFQGTISYEYDAIDDVGLLSVTLTNTSDPDYGGYITGFLFNIAGEDPSPTATLTTGTYPFTTATGNGLNGQPYGNPFDAGAALGGYFLGGGSPTDGIAIADTGVFDLVVHSYDAAFLTATSFIEGGGYEFNFIVRFKAIDDGASDKVPAAVIIPLPPALAMGGLGLLGAMFGVRRIRRR